MRKASPQKSDGRFAAMLLFQFRVVTNGVSNRRRLCEKRLVVLEAPSGRDALKEAKRRGRKSEHNYLNSDGGRVFFEFVGVLDLLSLGPECEDGEVWYQLCEMLEPHERRDRLIPAEVTLQAIDVESRSLKKV